MTMVKTLVALATERMLLKTSGPTFLRGIEFMYAAGLAPDRLSVMMTSSHKFVLQFHSKCDIRPFAANYPNFGRVLRGIVHVREWRIKSIEFVNVAFYMRDVDNLERAIEKLGVELVLLRNCTYPGVARGEEAVKFLSALNRKKQAVVCEYGDDRLKHRIGRRTGRVRRNSRNGQEVVVEPVDAPAAQGALENEVAAPAAAEPERAGVGGLLNANREIPPPPAPERMEEEEPQPIPFEPYDIEEANRRGPPYPRGHMLAHPPPLPPGAPVPPVFNHVVYQDVRVRNDYVVRQGQYQPQQPQQQPPPPTRRVAVGNHVYEFRQLDDRNGDNTPVVNNLQSLINILTNETTNSVRVIVFPNDVQQVQVADARNGGVYHNPPNVNHQAPMAVLPQAQILYQYRPPTYQVNPPPPVQMQADPQPPMHRLIRPVPQHHPQFQQHHLCSDRERNPAEVPVVLPRDYPRQVFDAHQEMDHQEQDDDSNDSVYRPMQNNNMRQHENNRFVQMQMQMNQQGMAQNLPDHEQLELQEEEFEEEDVSDDERMDGEIPPNFIIQERPI